MFLIYNKIKIFKFFMFTLINLNFINLKLLNNKNNLFKNVKFNNGIFFKNLIIFWLINKTKLSIIFSSFRFRLTYFFNIKSNILSFKRTIFLDSKLRFFKRRIHRFNLTLDFNENNYIYLQFLKQLKYIRTLFMTQRRLFLKTFSRRNKKYTKFRYLLFSLAYLMKTYRIRLLNFKALSFKKYNIFQFKFSIFVRKNNIFVLFKINGDIIYQFSSGILKLKGKKKRAPLTATNLTKYLSYHVSRFLYYNRKVLGKFSSKVYIDVYLYSFLSSPIVKSFMYILRENRYPISILFDKVKYSHSLGVKKKKLRRV